MKDEPLYKLISKTQRQYDVLTVVRVLRNENKDLLDRNKKLGVEVGMLKSHVAELQDSIFCPLTQKEARKIVHHFRTENEQMKKELLELKKKNKRLVEDIVKLKNNQNAK